MFVVGRLIEQVIKWAKLCLHFARFWVHDSQRKFPGHDGAYLANGGVEMAGKVQAQD